MFKPSHFPWRMQRAPQTSLFSPSLHGENLKYSLSGNPKEVQDSQDSGHALIKDTNTQYY